MYEEKKHQKKRNIIAVQAEQKHLTDFILSAPACLFGQWLAVGIRASRDLLKVTNPAPGMHLQKFFSLFTYIVSSPRPRVRHQLEQNLALLGTR